MDAMRIPLTTGAKPSAILPKQRVARMSIKVAMISDIKLQGLWSIAGPGAKMPTQLPSSGPVSLKCG